MLKEQNCDMQSDPLSDEETCSATGNEHMTRDTDSNTMSKEDTSKIGVIICLGGAFNPVHTRHVMALVEGKKWLEDKLNYKVIAGRMAVAPDGYVLSKTKRTNQKCMKIEHRIQLCAHACEDYNDWLLPYPKPCGSAFECGKRLKFDLRKEIKNFAEIKIAVILGADRAIIKSGPAKWRKECNHVTLCIGRAGETKRVMEYFDQDKAAGNIKHSEFYIVPHEMDNVSSTLVRRELCLLDEEKTEEGKRKIVEKLVQDGMINGSCAEYIITNEKDLYLTY